MAFWDDLFDSLDDLVTSSQKFIRENPELVNVGIAITGVGISYAVNKALENDPDAPHPLAVGAATAVTSVAISTGLQEWARPGGDDDGLLA